MRSMTRGKARRVTLAVALMASAAWVTAGAASAAVPAYTCGTPTVYTVPVPQGGLGGIAAGDLNRDGFPDVATADLASTGSVFLNNRFGRLAPGVNYSLASARSTADGAGSPLLVDVNGDRKLDLVTANFYGESVSVVLGKGDGTFYPAATYPTGRHPLQVVAGDFNHDGHLDLVALTFTQSYSAPAAALLLGTGYGSFRLPQPIALPSTAMEIVAGDFNRDGVPDLATANSNNSTYSVSVLLNKGGGMFAGPTSYPVGPGPFGFATGDLNGDGFPDLVTANVTDNTFSVLLNKGDGTGRFNPATSYPGGGGQMNTIVADINGDGHPDIVAANPYGNNIMVLLNQGHGTFGAPLICPNAPAGANVRGPLYLAAADLNQDGKLDLVTANLSAGNNPPTISTLITP